MSVLSKMHDSKLCPNICCSLVLDSTRSWLCHDLHSLMFYYCFTTALPQLLMFLANRRAPVCISRSTPLRLLPTPPISTLAYHLPRLLPTPSPPSHSLSTHRLPSFPTRSLCIYNLYMPPARLPNPLSNLCNATVSHSIRAIRSVRKGARLCMLTYADVR